MTPVRGAFFRFLLASLFLLAGALSGAPQSTAPQSAAPQSAATAAVDDCPGHHDENGGSGKRHPAGAVCCAVSGCAALPAAVADVPSLWSSTARRPPPPVSDRLSAGLAPAPALRPPALSA